MTQKTNLSITLFRVYGKDRLSDDWIPYESRFRWEVEEWAELRAWVQLNEDETLLVEERTPGPARLEWFCDGEWQPYTAYVPYERAVKDLENQARYNPANRFRIVEEDA